MVVANCTSYMHEYDQQRGRYSMVESVTSIDVSSWFEICG